MQCFDGGEPPVCPYAANAIDKAEESGTEARRVLACRYVFTRWRHRYLSQLANGRLRLQPSFLHIAFFTPFLSLFLSFLL